MIILPAEHALDWKHPPWATLGLIGLCCLIFFAYQMGDDERTDAVFSHYQSAALMAVEYPHYLQFYEREAPERAERAQALYQDRPTWLVGEMAFDPAFAAYLRQEVFVSTTLANEEIRAWATAREELRRLKQELSWRKYGVSPADPVSAGFIASIFMHGDFDHLFGNMLFLFVVGYALERAFGKARYLALFLATGLFANLLYVLIEWQQEVYGVGASGAIAGLMGAYLGLYGTKPIRFFFTIGFYFNYFKASAALIFPLWVAKELYGEFFTDTHINYWAHLGGLLSGYGLAMLGRKRWLKVDEAFVEKVDPLADFKRRHTRLLQLVSDLKMDEARAYGVQMLHDYPEQTELIETLARLLKQQPNSDGYKRFLAHVLSLPISAANVAIQADVVKQHLEQHGFSLYFKKPQVCCKLGVIMAKHSRYDLAERLLKHVLQQAPKEPLLAELLMRVSKGMAHNQRPKDQRRYLEVLVKLFPHTTQAQTAKNFLQTLA